MSDNFYRSVIDDFPVGYVRYKIVYDEDDRINDYKFIEANKKFQKIIGLAENELIGCKATTVLEDRGSWLDFHHSLENDYEDTEVEHYFEIINKHYKINIHYPDHQQMIMFFRDITIEREQEENYELFADNTDLQIWRFRDPYTYAFANKSHADFLGVDKKDMEQQLLTNFYDPLEAALCIEGNKIVYEEKRKLFNDEWIVNAEGKSRLIRILKNPKFNQQGEVEFISCSAEDITEEYELEKEKKVKEEILYAMIHFTEDLLTNNRYYQALANSIELLGNATQVDRVYYWENHYDKKKKEWFTSQKFEWCLDGVTKQIDNPKLQNNSFEEVGSFIGTLAENQALMTHVKDMEDTKTKRIFESQDILSILVLPVFTNGFFKGFIGFDSCRFEREWTAVEISLLNSFVLLYERAVEKSFMEQHLIQVKENFDNFFNMIDDLLLVLDQEGSIISANDTVLKKLGYASEELFGQSASKIHPKEKIEVAVNRMDSIKSGKINSFNTLAIAKDGTTIPIETHISEGIWDGEDVLFAVSKDISELTMSEEKFSKAFNLSGISMIISTIDDGEFIEVNDAFLELIGYEREKIIGEKIDTQNVFRCLEGQNSCRKSIRKEIEKNQRIYNYEIEIITKESEVRVGLCNIVSVKINNQLYFLTSIVDVTESKLMTEELAAAKKESDIANQAKSQFLSHISHEIRTPMNAVIGYSDLLSSTILTNKQKRYIEGIKASTAMLMSIINDILDWSKIDNDGIELEVAKFAIDDVIGNVVEQQLFKNMDNVPNKVKISIEKDEKIPDLLYGDYLRLQQVLLNLLSNAVKFTEFGEIKIKVNVAHRATDKITLGFEVIDTGIGIANEVIPDIFEPFKQADNRITSSLEGTGLGLAISKSIVELMNGKIGVKSQLNKGSTFFFTVDLGTKGSVESLPYEERVDYDQENEFYSCDQLINSKVLVVDDNLINQDVLKEILEDIGVIVTLVSSGREAIEKVKTKKYDLVLMDLRMPLMDGYETTEEIRKMKSALELPIIAVSASVSPDEVRKCREAGIREFITKPIEKKKLFKAMSKSLNKEQEHQKENVFIEQPFIGEAKKVNRSDYPVEGIDVEKAIKHLNNNENLFLRILKRFKQNHENVVDEIKRAQSLGDTELATRLAHTIKGVSGELSATEVYALSSELENELIKETADYSDLLNKLEQALHRIFSSEIFKEEKKENKSTTFEPIDIEAITPLLKDLGMLLQESDLDGIKMIQQLDQKTKNTVIHQKIKEMKEFGEQYDFVRALDVFDEINNLLNEKESL